MARRRRSSGVAEEGRVLRLEHGVVGWPGRKAAARSGRAGVCWRRGPDSRRQLAEFRAPPVAGSSLDVDRRHPGAVRQLPLQGRPRAGAIATAARRQSASRRRKSQAPIMSTMRRAVPWAARRPASGVRDGATGMVGGRMAPSRCRREAPRSAFHEADRDRRTASRQWREATSVLRVADDEEVLDLGEHWRRRHAVARTRRSDAIPR